MLHKQKKYKQGYFSIIQNCIVFAFITMSQLTLLTGQQSLICKTSIQISVNDNCEAEVNADLLLQNYDRYLDYKIELQDDNGADIEGLILNLDHLGQEITATVTHLKNNISCWSKILVESKIFPEFDGCHDVIVSCHAYPDTLQYMSNPEISGTQCGSYSMSYEDRVEEQLCAEDGYSQIVYRKWILINESGFEYDCTQRILVQRPTIDDIYFPPHFNNEDYKAISCDYVLQDDGSVKYDHDMEFVENNIPSTNDFPYGTGTPGGQFCGNMKVNFNDTYYPSCGNQVKILRQWHIIDWCTDQDKVKDQIIEVLDDKGPILEFAEKERSIKVNYDNCLATIKSVPYPMEVHDCSETTYSISYKYQMTDGKMSAEMTEGISSNQDKTYSINKIPSDYVMMVYHVYDDCGHYSTCEIPFDLIDTQAPIAICEKTTIITLNESGQTELWASNLQHHSVDNCEIIHQEIKRKHEVCEGFDNDLEFGEKISFCCTDVGDQIYDVILRVYDAHGNYADCHTEIQIQDKIKPHIIKCVPHKTIQCNTDYHDMELMGGEPQVADNCGMTMEYSDDTSSLNSCGFGVIYRNWKATDDHGNWSDCIQEITIESESISSVNDIIWPRTKTLSECVRANISSELLGEPQLPYNDCAHISFNYEDQVFYEDTESCMKILRNWTVIDWCKYDPGFDNSQGQWTHTQVIKLSDSTIPVIENECEDIVVNISDDLCYADISLVINASDDCSLDQLTYSQRIHLENGEVIEKNGQELSEQLNSGKHTVEFSVSDGCGNTNECHFNIEVIQETTLQVICIEGVSLSLGATGETEIWASDFIKDVNSNCFNTETIDYSFSIDSLQSVIKFNCGFFNGADESRNTEQLQVFAIDGTGVSGSCVVDLTFTDNFNLCAEENTSSAVISGEILLENEIAIPEKMVTLNNMSDNSKLQDMTNNAGGYSFNTELYHDYKIDIDASGVVLEGVSTLDLIQIQKHILNQFVLDSPYKIIAADIDQSKSISVSDLIFLRKIILGIDSQFPNGEVWKFIQQDFSFIDNAAPWNFPQDNYIADLSHNMSDQNYVAVKMGDVNLSYSEGIEQRNLEALTVLVEQDSDNDNRIKISFKPSSFKSIIGYQLSLHFDSKEIKFLDIKDASGISMESAHYTIDTDGINISYNQNQLKEIKTDNELFSLWFENRNGNFAVKTIQLNQDFKNEFYTNNLDVIEVSKIREHVKESATIKILESYPNPFITETKIQFYSKHPSPVKIIIYDSLGKDVYSKSFNSKGGLETHAITFPENLKTGIYYCRIEAGQKYDLVQLYKSDN